MSKDISFKVGRGFTLIEIVIVLAIAAALILLVFTAVSGAQKAKRDQINKTAAGRIGSEIGQYASNNGGVAPTAALGTSYLGNIVDGQGGSPAYAAASATATKAAAGSGTEIKYSGTALCVKDDGPGGYVNTGAGANNYAVDYYSESGGSDVCVDNS